MKEKNWIRRGIFVTLGVLCVGLGIAFFRTSCFGSDPYTCFVISLSCLFGISYGTASLIINSLLLIVLLLFGRKFIGLGTVINMVLVGYSSDFFVFLLSDVAHLPEELSVFVRVLFLIAGVLIFWFGMAMYLSPAFGCSPYEGFSYTLEYRLNVPFKINRVIVDLTCLVIGGAILFSLDGWSLLFNYVNVGTVVVALFTGPAVSFIRSKTERLVGTIPKK